MRKISVLVTSIILITAILSLGLIGCGVPKEDLAKAIHFDNISNDELNFSHLEINADNKVALVIDNIIKYEIVVPENMSPSIKRAIDDIQDVMLDMTGNIIDREDSTIHDTGNIYIINDYDDKTGEITNDGFIIDIDDNITIAGKDNNATRNGIYYFLEEYLGVVYVSPTEDYIPKHSNIYIEKGRKVINPKTAWRGVYAAETAENYWASKLMLNSIDVDKTDEEYNIDTKDMTSEEYRKKLLESRNYNEWGTWCHSFYRYLSPEEYFDTHPEYFSLFKGERTHYYKGIDAHLCLSNEEVYNIVEKRLGEMIAEHPEVKYWDFSANDNWWIKGCECENCKRLDKEAGGTGMGTLLPFINRLARKYPNVYISTLAYNHTLKAPTNGIVPEDNVIIKLCAMPGDQASTYLDPHNNNAKVFNEQVKEWSKITKKIVIWDYTVNFANLLLPFPNFAVQQDNQKFYEDNNIEGIFHQSSREIGGELTLLRAYTLSKLMWAGSSLDYAKCVSRYVYAYYGAAAPKVIEYLNEMQSNLSKSSSNLGLYDRTTPHLNGYLSKDAISRYEAIINEAKELVKDDNIYLDRVEGIEANVMYAKMLLPNIDKTTRDNAQNCLNTLADKQNITMAREWESLEDFNNNLNKEIDSINKTINTGLYISLGVIGGIALSIIVVAVIFHVLGKKSREKTIIDNDKNN